MEHWNSHGWLAGQQMSKLAHDCRRFAHLTVPAVYSMEGSITFPLRIGFEISNVASVTAQVMNRESSASWDPVMLR